MTEAEWLACGDLEPMLASLRGEGWGRKLRLFATACCRAFDEELARGDLRFVLEAVERHADGGLQESQIERIQFHARGTLSLLIFDNPERVTDEWNHGEARHLLIVLLRDIFGNPFRPATLPDSHRTPAVVSLARSVYDERHLPSGELDPHRLAVLADALEEAGSPAELTDHLRAPGPHVRGCWVLDACLGLT